MRQLTLGVLLVGGGFLAGLAFQPGLPEQVAHAITGKPAPRAAPIVSQATIAPVDMPSMHVHSVAPGGAATPDATAAADSMSGMSASAHGHGDPGPGDPSCGLAQVAFCDPFDTPSAISRSGELDPKVWSVARLSQDNNPSQDAVNAWATTDAMHCKDLVHGVTAPHDFFECGPTYGESNHYMDAINDDGVYVYNSARVRQPFDFAGRTGTVTFSVDAQTKGEHSFWVEVWLTDEPIPAPHADTTATFAYPRNGLGLIFSDDCGQPGEQTRLRVVHVVRNFVDQGSNANDDQIQSTCFATMPDMMNRFELHLSADALAIDASDGGLDTLRQVASVSGLHLSFTRGYLNLQHAQYNAAKFGAPADAMHTYHWDNVGFDGPILPRDRGYDVADALTPVGNGGALNLGYVVNSEGIAVCCPLKHDSGFVIDGVDPGGVSAARLGLNVETLDIGARLRYRLNGGSWHETALPLQTNDGYSWRALSIVIDPRELRAGKNVIEMTATAEVTVANLGLDLTPAN